MEAVKVEYTVKPEFVEQNKTNVKKVMDRLRKDPIVGMLYSTFVKDDGQSFVHINFAKDAETMNKLNDLHEFADFRKALKESDPVHPPQSTKLNLVAGSFDL